MVKQSIIKVGMLVSYDWELLKVSVPRIYKYADLVCLSQDKNRKSWACNSYDFEEDKFRKWLKEMDTEKKITYYQDDFAISELNARENCDRQRMMMADKMGKDGWHIQVDADEYFFDFKEFVRYLINFNASPKFSDKPINMLVSLIPVIKKVNKGYLIVDFPNGKFEVCPLATNHPKFERARYNRHFNHLTNQFILHETRSRTADELWFKLNNWGHSAEELNDDAKKLQEFNSWKELDETNYHLVKNFHQDIPEKWPALDMIKAENIEELLETLPNVKQLHIPLSRRRIKNSRNIARLIALFKS